MSAWLAAQGYSVRRSGAELHARLAAAPPGVSGETADALAAVTLALVAAVAAIDEQAKALGARIAEQLERHPDRAIFTSLPRAGSVPRHCSPRSATVASGSPRPSRSPAWPA